mmetsp:Transcript_21052/g.34914  ORF Transcript_21052/g.34914 Transcript_21052/m.34914 type:complete len:95 (-) Transcript_21052:176-460(-)
MAASFFKRIIRRQQCLCASEKVKQQLSVLLDFPFAGVVWKVENDEVELPLVKRALKVCGINPMLYNAASLTVQKHFFRTIQVALHHILPVIQRG